MQITHREINFVLGVNWVKFEKWNSEDSPEVWAIYTDKQGHNFLEFLYSGEIVHSTNFAGVVESYSDLDSCAVSVNPADQGMVQNLTPRSALIAAFGTVDVPSLEISEIQYSGYLEKNHVVMLGTGVYRCSATGVILVCTQCRHAVYHADDRKLCRVG